jgi:hypothetical protein
MGATSWRYYTPHRADAEEALQRLRVDVFARGAYVDPTGGMEDQLKQMYRRFGEDPDSPAVRRRIDDALRLQGAIDTGDVSGLPAAERDFARRVREFGQLARLMGAAPPPARGRRPGSIEELLELAEESGTHSILDIERVAPRPGFGIAAPMSPTALTRAFGTTEPTHAQVEENWDRVVDRLNRWQCRYLALFRDGQPHEYAFIGCSGD